MVERSMPHWGTLGKAEWLEWRRRERLCSHCVDPVLSSLCSICRTPAPLPNEGAGSEKTGAKSPVGGRLARIIWQSQTWKLLFIHTSALSSPGSLSQCPQGPQLTQNGAVSTGFHKGSSFAKRTEWKSEAQNRSDLSQISTSEFVPNSVLKQIVL